MIKFNKIIAKNFLSFGNNENEYIIENGVFLLIGENKDNPGMSNGCGKTVILNALLYGLFGVIKGKKTKVDSVINNQNKKFEMSVEIDVNIGNDRYQIIRSRHKKQSSILLLKNGVDETTNGITNIDNEIERLIGMDSNIFSTLFVVNEGDGFMDKSDNEMKLIIENVLNLSFLRETADKLKNKRLESDREITNLEKQYELEMINYNKNLNDINNLKENSNTWENNHNLNLANCIKLLNELRSTNLDEIVKIINNYDNDLINYNNYINTSNELNNKINNYNNIIYTLKSTKDTLQQTKTSNINKNKEWEEQKILQISEATVNLTKYETIDKLNQYLKENDEIEENNNEIKKDIVNYGNKLNILNINKHSLEKNVISLEEEIEKTNKLIETINSGKCPTCLQPLIDKSILKNYENTLNEKQNKLLEIKSEIDNINIEINENVKLLNGLTPQIKEIIHDKNIINKQIEEINKINSFLQYKITEVNPYKIDDNIDIQINTINENINNNEQELNSIKIFINTLYIIDKPSEISYNMDFVNNIKNNIENQTNIFENLNKESNPYQIAMSLIQQNLDNSKKLELENELEIIKHKRNNYNTLQKLFGDADSPLRKAILDQLLHQVNESISNNLQMLGLPHNVFLTNDLDIEIEYENNNYEYVLMSGGQRRRINLAITFSLLSIYNYTHNPLNILFLDEVDQGKINGLGLEQLVKTIYELTNNQNLCTTVISHSEIVHAKIANHITIQMEDGFSSIIQ